MLSPEDNNERQPIHDHESVLRSANEAACIGLLAALAVHMLAAPPDGRAAGSLHRRHRGRPASTSCTTAAGAGKKWLPETLGSGCAFFDADGDGWPDILLDQRQGLDRRAAAASTAALYRNNHDGTFTDITAGSGLDIEMYGMGVAVGDYDNDGRDDVYITALDGDHLFHNEGGGKFRDVTRESGIHNASFGTSAAWLDYDRDGKLDLFVANYVQWTAEARSVVLARWLDQIVLHAGIVSRARRRKLYHNLGNGKFEDVTEKAGLGDPTSKSLGVAVLDYNNDGWPDLFVANDTQPNKLYRNNRNGTFHGRRTVARAWRSAKTAWRAAPWAWTRPITTAPAGRTCWSGISPTRCWGCITTKATGCSWMKRRAPPWAAPACCRLTFGVFFFDYDLDGYPDIFAANGHIEEEIGRVQPKIQLRASRRCCSAMWARAGSRMYRDAGRRTFTRPMVARGAAYADFDHDGDLDVLISTNNGPAHLYATTAATAITG